MICDDKGEDNEMVLTMMIMILALVQVSMTL